MITRVGNEVISIALSDGGFLYVARWKDPTRLYLSVTSAFGSASFYLSEEAAKDLRRAIGEVLPETAQ